MINLNINTEKMRSCGNEIIAKSEDLNTSFDNLYSRIDNMNKKTGEWVGNGANDFIAIIDKEKLDNYNVKNAIADYGNCLVKAADSFESAYNEVKL